jgi:hypothetical protein
MDRERREELIKYGQEYLEEYMRTLATYSKPPEKCWTMQNLLSNDQLESLMIDALKGSILHTRRLVKSRQREGKYTHPQEEIGFLCTDLRRSLAIISRYPGMETYCKSFTQTDTWASPGVIRGNHFESHWRQQIPSANGIWDLTKDKVVGYCAKALSQALAIDNGQSPEESETIEDSFREMDKLLADMQGNVVSAQKLNTEADTVCASLCQIAESLQK